MVSHGKSTGLKRLGAAVENNCCKFDRCSLTFVTGFFAMGFNATLRERLFSPFNPGNKMNIQLLPIERITTDVGLQMRVVESESVIDDYAEAIRQGDVLPPITVFTEGTHFWLVDGFHRLAAYKKAGLDSIPCVVRQGTFNEAKACACEANTDHGYRRSNPDKRNAVREYLTIPEKAELSNNEIGKRLKVSHHLVHEVRDEMGLKPSPKSHVGRGGQEGIGKFQSKKKPSKKPHSNEKTGGFVDLYNISTESPGQFVSILNAEFSKSYLISLSTELQRFLAEHELSA